MDRDSGQPPVAIQSNENQKDSDVGMALDVMRQLHNAQVKSFDMEAIELTPDEEALRTEVALFLRDHFRRARTGKERAP